MPSRELTNLAIREIKEILGDLFDEILSLREAGVSADPEETGETFEENGLKFRYVDYVRK